MANTETPLTFHDGMKKLKEFASIVGDVNMSWGDCQFFIYVIFARLMAGDIHRAEAIFFSLKTDRAQRDVTGALGKLVLKNHPDLQTRLSKLIGNLETLAGERNDVIHAMWGVQLGEPKLLAGSSPRLREKPLKETLEQTALKIKKVAMDLSALNRQIADALPPWPNTPQ
jgi:hypothetical protein